MQHHFPAEDDRETRYDDAAISKRTSRIGAARSLAPDEVVALVSQMHGKWR